MEPWGFPLQERILPHRAIQVVARWLGNPGLDIPFRVVFRDERLVDPERSILGIWSTNLYTGAAYAEMHLDMLISAGDENKVDSISVKAKAEIKMMPGSKGVSWV